MHILHKSSGQNCNALVVIYLKQRQVSKMKIIDNVNNSFDEVIKMWSLIRKA